MSPLNTAGRHKRKAPCPSRRSGLRFEAPAVARHGKAESEINQSHEQVDLDTERLPRGIDDGGLRCRQQVEDRKSVVEGKSVDLGGRRIIKKKKKKRKK